MERELDVEECEKEGGQAEEQWRTELAAAVHIIVSYRIQALESQNSQSEDFFSQSLFGDEKVILLPKMLLLLGITE